MAVYAMYKKTSVLVEDGFPKCTINCTCECFVKKIISPHTGFSNSTVKKFNTAVTLIFTVIVWKNIVFKLKNSK